MPTTETIKLAGPDTDGNFKVLSTKNTTLVYPGEVYTESVFRELVRIARGQANARKLEVTAVEHRPGPTDFGFSEASGGKVFERLKNDR